MNGIGNHTTLCGDDAAVVINELPSATAGAQNFGHYGDVLPMKCCSLVGLIISYPVFDQILCLVQIRPLFLQ